VHFTNLSLGIIKNCFETPNQEKMMPPNLDTSSTGLNVLLLFVLFAIFFFVLKSKKDDDKEQK